MIPGSRRTPAPDDHDAVATAIGARAVVALYRELCLEPKPGLVGMTGTGSHRDMDAHTLVRSLSALRPGLVALARAGLEQRPFSRLRAVGLQAEARMLAATGGINTHRGALFSLGLLAAAAGRRTAVGAPLTAEEVAMEVRFAYGAAILAARDPAADTHGERVRRRFGGGGAREEAAAGFPTLRRVALPAYRAARRGGAGEEAAGVQTLFTLIATLHDTNLLHRGGAKGLAHARAAASTFLAAGGVHRPRWRTAVHRIGAGFVARSLSPGGAADLLAATLFLDRLESVRDP
jgi:triphosphoribosyl-dephospho-CoA synthase